MTPPLVIKLGGRALEDAAAIGELAAELAPIAANAVLVHGGGAEVSEWSHRLGLEPAFVDGRRVTDAATLEVAVAVLAGLANKRLVAALRAGGIDAVGLAALDGGVAEVAPHSAAATLGEVGEVRAIRADLIHLLLATGHTPVLSSVGACDGRLLNLNADDFAAALAAALGSPALLMFSDVEGVRLSGAIVRQLGRAELDRALAGGDVEGGMRAKLDAASAAIDRGVARIVIGRWQGRGTLQAMLDGQTGTMLPAQSLEVLHG